MFPTSMAAPASAKHAHLPFAAGSSRSTAAWTNSTSAGGRPSGPYLHRLAADRAALRQRRAPDPRPDDRLSTLPERLDAGMLQAGARRAASDHARYSDHHQP